MIYAVSLLAAAAAVALLLARAFRGPTVFDRLVAANSVGTVAILIVALYGFATERPEFLDIAIVYALLNVVGTFAVLKFFRHGALGHEADGEDEHGASAEEAGR